MDSERKIHIIGSVGSGKTTLAKQLSRKLNIPYYEIDNIIFERQSSGDCRRSDEEIVKRIEEISKTETWILEGTSTKEWVINSFKNADSIIFLDTSYFIRVKRILFRYVKQVLKVEKANYKPTFSMLINMFKWNHKFNKVNKTEFHKLTQEYKNKVRIYPSKLNKGQRN